MQFTARHFSLFCTLAAWLTVEPFALSAAQEVGSSLYMRNDSDGTTVLSPRLRVAGDVSDTRIEAVYTVDVWSSASIDIRTAATQRVYEQRDEIDLAASHVIQDSTLSANYRYSKENDYESHGGSLSMSQDFADRSTTLALSLSGIFDQVGRAGDPAFSRALRTYGARLSLTQVLDPETLLQVSYDLFILDGFQESPYRKVRLLDMSPGCEEPPAPGELNSPTAYNGCRIYERVPQRRFRHAVALQGRRALSSKASLGLGYRLYLDNWGLGSHTVEARFAYLLSRSTTLTARYRFYSQGAADFYQPYYTDSRSNRTSDRELSGLSSHRIGLDLEQEFELGPLTVLGALAAGFNRYAYDAFPGLTAVRACELTAALSAEF